MSSEKKERKEIEYEGYQPTIELKTKGGGMRQAQVDVPWSVQAFL